MCVCNYIDIYIYIYIYIYICIYKYIDTRMTRGARFWNGYTGEAVGVPLEGHKYPVAY